MSVDEGARHRLYVRREEVLGAEEAGILMDHLPPRGFGDLATKGDLDLLRAATKSDLEAFRAEAKSDLDAFRAEAKSDVAALRAETKSEIASVRADLQGLEHALSARIESMGRRVVMWTSSMVLATGGLVAAVTRLA